MQGRGNMPGVATGIAVVVTDLDSGRSVSNVGEQSILVCLPGSHTCRTNWLSILLTVGGAVVPYGGLHHITQIARECGRVFVVLLPEELARIPQGCELVLDGSAGTVTVSTLKKESTD